MPASKEFRSTLAVLAPQILKQNGNQPFLIYDERGILNTALAFEMAMNGCGFRNHFAVKALPNPAIVKSLWKNRRFGADCSSIPELMIARQVGITPDKIMFTSNDTTPEEFRVAMADGESIVNFDDFSMLSTWPRKLKFPKFFCIRFNPGSKRKGTKIIGDPKEAKYGMREDQILAAYRLARANGSTQFGLHTMICSNQLDATYHLETIKMQLKLALKIYREAHIMVEFINVGGGIGTPYHPEQPEFDIHRLGDGARKLLNEFKAANGWVPKLHFECGRYITGPHGILVNPVIHVMDKHERFVGVPAGMVAVPRPAVYGAYHHITCFDGKGRPLTTREIPQHVVGPTCENCDQLTADGDKVCARLLPEMKIGNIVFVENAGAHCYAMSSNYNGRTRVAEYLIRLDRSIVMIRRAETPKDLFRTLSGFKRGTGLTVNN